MEQSADTHLGLAKKQLLQALQKLSAQENYEMAESVLELLKNLKAITADSQSPSCVAARLTTKERTLINQGLLIDAIKELRARTNCGLKEAKDLCEAYRDRRPPPAG